MKGKLIAIEGLDGSGKATQASLLADALRRAGTVPTQVSFPCYGSDAAKLLEAYLHGAFGNDPNDVNAFAASTFFAVDRYVSYQSSWKKVYEAGGTILADRYTTSNAIHQCAKLPQAEWDSFLDWLFSYEYTRLGLPSPDAVIYLRVPTSVSQGLMHKRYDGDDSRKDIHEANLAYLTACREAADYCAAALCWHTVECMAGDSLRPADEIHAEICKVLGIA